MPAHRINRAELELDVSGVELAEALIQRVSELHERAIAPLLDRVCSELSGPGQIDRIDRLELDLGRVDLDDFDQDLLRKLEAALRSALSDALRVQAPRAPIDAARELIETFAWTCNLPWWAEPGGAEPGAMDPVAASIGLLVREAPRELVVLVHELDEEPRALARVIECLDEPTLVRLGRSEVAARLPIALQHAIAAAIARAEGVDREVFPGARADEANGDRLVRPVESHHIDFESDDIDDDSRSLDSQIENVSNESREQDDVKNVTISNAEIASTLIESDATLVDEPERMPSTEVPAANLPITPSQQIDPIHPSAPPARASPPDQAASTPDHAASVPDGEPTPSAAPVSPRPPSPHAAARRRAALDQLDELYVQNGGLVILWPFVERFFARVGLIDLDRNFIDEPARMQAIALLELLASDDPDPPQHRLPLAKLLCGCPPEHDFVLERALEPEQVVECERLLAAVIDNAPILRAMAVTSFRAAFLHRPALLCIRDGAWLLQVERRSHDVVLERFPWSWEWVKLPWMADPLQVEW